MARNDQCRSAPGELVELLPEFDAQDGVLSAATDHKSALQEMAQALKLPPPRYVIVAEDGGKGLQ